MATTPEQFAELLTLGHEVRGVEFKGPGSLRNKQLVARVVRAVLAMANTRDGGRIVIGVQETNDKSFEAVGLSSEEAQSWNHDAVSGLVSGYADPFVELTTEPLIYNEKNFVLLHVREFAELPVICKKDYPGVLREGACYVRSFRKPESAEIPTRSEMRSLLSIAIEKGVRRFVRQAQSAALFPDHNQETDDDSDRFQRQLGDFQ